MLIPDLAGNSDTPMSRRKSFKKSLRESFRRMRKGRSEKRKREAKKDDKRLDPRSLIKITLLIFEYPIFLF